MPFWCRGRGAEFLYEGDIRDSYIRTKTLAEATAKNADTVDELERLLCQPYIIGNE